MEVESPTSNGARPARSGTLRAEAREPSPQPQAVASSDAVTAAVRHKVIKNLFMSANLPGGGLAASVGLAGAVGCGSMTKPMMSRSSALIAALALTALLLSACVAHARPTATAASTCDVSKDGRKLGATYVTALSATKVSCTKAKKAVKAFHACRRAHGGVKGTCRSFGGYSCKETRKAIPTQFSAKVTCSASGGRRLKFSYTQFT
jgi:hypothetical protein